MLQEYPFVAHLYMTWDKVANESSKGFCSAAILNESFVVSAAHCFVNWTTGILLPNQRVKVTAGTSDIHSCNETYKQIVYVYF